MVSPAPRTQTLPRLKTHAYQNSDVILLEEQDNVSASGPSDLSQGDGTPVTRGRTFTGMFERYVAESFKRVQAGLDRNKGLLLIIASQFFVALMNLTVKLLSKLDKPVPTFELVAVRMSITGVCCVGYMFWAKVPHPILGPPDVRSWLAIRGVTGFFGLFGMYFSLQYLSLSDATAITFLSPSTIALCGFLFLHERLRGREILAGLFALVGVLLIARPEALFGPSSSDSSGNEATPSQRLMAVGVSLLGVLGVTGALISIRIISTRAHAMHSIAYYSVWCVIVSTIGTFALGTRWVIPADPRFAIGLFMTGAFGFLGQVLLTIGLQYETATRGSIGLYVQIIYSSVLERVFLHTKPSILSIIGTCIIVSSAFYVAITKSSKPSATDTTLPLATTTITDRNSIAPEGSNSYGNPGVLASAVGYAPLPSEADDLDPRDMKEENDRDAHSTA